jgi:diguanylate cyclase (GGDEF)-like protein
MARSPFARFKVPDRRVGYMNDVTNPADADNQAERLVDGFESHGAGWLWETDREGRVTYLSEKISEQLDQAYHPIIGRPLAQIFKIAAVSERVGHELAAQLSARSSFDDLIVESFEGKNEQRWLISGHPCHDRLGRFSGFVGSGSDLSDTRQSDAEIARLAKYDPLTGLSNRAHMAFTLKDALDRSRTTYRPIGLLLLDLDRFKLVNDAMGHQTGDLLLQHVAERLTRCVGDKGLVGRLGGDEFLVILPGSSNRRELSELCSQLIDKLSQPYSINDGAFSIGCSIGIAIAPEHGEDADIIIRNADLALYSAKADGRGRYQFYREELLHDAKKRKLLEDDLRVALPKGQLHLVYQPIVSTSSGQVVGYEALMRWTHPTRGPISPTEFIPVAEEVGLIDELGAWALKTACASAAQWPVPVRVAVNVSAIQFAKQSLPAIVAGALAASGLEPHRLELEITESIFVDEGPSTARMFDALKGLGVRLVLDDFGTGYASFGYLRTAPFDKIKIDQSFIRGATLPGNRNSAIIKAIVTLAETLGMETTAEGVEAQDETSLVAELGCSHVQGFVYGQPIAPEILRAQLLRQQPVNPVGLKVTRLPRTTTLRSTSLRQNGKLTEARIRNVSAEGVMIDNFPDVELVAETEVEIELDGHSRSALVRWVKDGRAGLRLGGPCSETGL